MKRIGLSLIILLLLSACAAAQPAPTSMATPIAELPPTTIPESSAAHEAPAPYLITFTGEGCVSEVPETLPLGKHSFLFVNETESRLALWIAGLPEDVSYKDLLDKQPGPGEYFSTDDLMDRQSEFGWYFLAPYDLRLPAKLVDRSNDPSEGRFYTFLFYEEGEYSHALGGLNLDALWFCAPFHIIGDSPSG
jgi:hypothetical protein